MPELPEVETIARGVNERLKGDRIVEVWFGSHVEPFKTPSTEQAAGLEGREIASVRRVGKHIVCDLGPNEGAIGGAEWIVHLGMTGRLLVTTPEAEVVSHTHARLRLKSGRELRFVDPRRFGRLEFRSLEDRIGSAEPFAGPGAEPLTITTEEFAALFRGRRLAIKAALLNQTLLHGVGNIYADESLFRAGIRPRRMAGRLSRGELNRLHMAIQEVLRQAIDLGGSSVSDYVDVNGVRGFFQLEHRVYLRTGQPCLICGLPIKRIVLAGRGTHFCPACQR
jgi:formamidopyrimidine-DNA glycosylase